MAISSNVVKSRAISALKIGERFSLGGASAYDPDALYTSARVGDFYTKAGFFEDGSPYTNQADAPGDPIYTFKGGRTTPGPYTDHPDQATVASRWLVASDADYGIVAQVPGGTAKFALGLVNAALQTGINTNGGTWFARIKVDVAANIGVNGHAVVAYDRTNGGLFIVSGNLRFGASTASSLSVSLTPYDGTWITIVATRTAAGACEVYINDPDTPVVTGNPGSFGTLTRIIVGQPASAGSGTVSMHRFGLIDNVGGATIAEWMSFAEAA